MRDVPLAELGVDGPPAPLAAVPPLDDLVVDVEVRDEVPGEAGGGAAADRRDRRGRRGATHVGARQADSDLIARRAHPGEDEGGAGAGGRSAGAQEPGPRARARQARSEAQNDPQSAARAVL